MSYYATLHPTTETYAWAKAATYYVDFSENKPGGVTNAVVNLPNTIQQYVTQDAVVPTQVPTLAGYIFKGYKWGNTDVAPGDTIAKQAADTHVTLEAQWEKIASVTPPATTASATTTPATIMPVITTLAPTIPATTMPASLPLVQLQCLPIPHIQSQLSPP